MLDHKDYDSTVDNWCIGVLTYEFLCGQPPFKASEKSLMYERIRKLDLRFPSHVSDLAQDFIRQLLVLNPKDRMPLWKVKDHPWIKKYENFSLTSSICCVCYNCSLIILHCGLTNGMKLINVMHSYCSKEMLYERRDEMILCDK